MSLKEWKNNELNNLLMKKFGILKEEKSYNRDDEESEIQEKYYKRDEDEEELEEAKEKKPDEDGDGVPDWADKKPGEDDNKVDIKEVVRKVLKNNKKIMEKLKDS